MKEYKFYFSDSETMVFPDDYPTTKSYEKYIKRRTSENLEKYYLLPPSKRVNYQRIGNPFPFCPNWNFHFSDVQSSSQNMTILINTNNKIVIKQQIELVKEKNLCEYSFDLCNLFLVPIQVEAIKGGGIPEFNSLLCMPTEEDIRIYFKQENLRKPNLLIDTLNVTLLTY